MLKGLNLSGFWCTLSTHRDKLWGQWRSWFSFPEWLYRLAAFYYILLECKYIKFKIPYKKA